MRLLHHRLLVTFLVVLFLTFGVVFSVATKTYSAPDERMHAWYVRHLAETRTLPVLTAEKVTQEAHQPPLYYLVLQPTYWFFSDVPERTQVLALRFTGLLLALFALAATFRLAALFTPDQPWVAFTATAFVALHPQWIYSASTINNDVLTVILSSIGFVLLVRTIQVTTVTRRLAVQSALVITGLLMTKLSAWPLAAVLGIFLTVRLFRARQYQSLAWLLIPAMTVSAWLVRNVLVYHDILLTTTMHNLWYATQHRTWLTPHGIRIWCKTVVESYWARFGYFTIALPKKYYQMIWAAVGVLTTSGAVALTRDWRRRVFRTEWMLVLLVVVLTCAMLFVYSLSFYQPQGRYLLPLLPVFAVWAARGVHTLIPKKFAPYGFALVILAMTLLDVRSFLAIVRAG